MKSFKEWFCFLEGLNIVHIDPEEDWDMADRAYQIAAEVNIRPSRVKEPTIVALNGEEEVIGAVFTSWEQDNDASNDQGEPIARYDFDVVVDPKWQGYEQVGIKLIHQAEKERENLESDLGQKAYTQLWVVNPKLARILQTPKFGYSSEGELSDGSTRLVKY